MIYNQNPNAKDPNVDPPGTKPKPDKNYNTGVTMLISLGMPLLVGLTVAIAGYFKCEKRCCGRQKPTDLCIN